jgi:hypothetical protein
MQHMGLRETVGGGQSGTMGAATVGGPVATQRVHGAVALALGRVRSPWPGGPRLALKWWAGGVPSGPWPNHKRLWPTLFQVGQLVTLFQLINSFPNIECCLHLKNRKTNLHDLQNFQILPRGR